MLIYIDLETYCETPINAGTYRYAEKAEVMLIAYAINNGPVFVHDRTVDTALPELLVDAIEAGGTLVAHNAQFDRVLFNTIYPTPIEQWRCTMAQAYAHGLPGKLDHLCDIFRLGVDERKLKDGKALVQLFCKPRPKNSTLRRATRDTHPQEWARFVDYAGMDVVSMRAIMAKLPTWNYPNSDGLRCWHMDQRINDRGFRIDTRLAEAAIGVVASEQKSLAKRVSAATGGSVASATKRDSLLSYLLLEYGVDLPDLQRDTLERRIDDPSLPPELRELLALRVQSSSSTVAKYKAAQRCVGSDERLRGGLAWSGAQRTMRWAGRLFQPQNLMRPTMKAHDIESAIELILAGQVHLIYSNVTDAVSNAVRGLIVAASGRKLCVSDLANIEGRTAAYLAGEDWKLDAFRAFDNGEGEDLYKVSYGEAFHIDPKTVTKPQRQVGKVMELMLQYQGGVGAFVTGAETYGVDLEELGRVALPVLPKDVVADARAFMTWVIEKNRPTFGLSENAFYACDGIKRLWRARHPAIVSFWEDLEDAVRKAVARPGRWIECRKVSMRVDGVWLRIMLPSGRCVCYPGLRVDDAGKISYMGMNQYTKRWSRIWTYGGKLLENITQALSRDVMVEGMYRAEDSGYPVVLTVHDELLTEPEDSPAYTHEGLGELLSTPPAWAPDLPLAAGGFTGYRYRKD